MRICSATPILCGHSGHQGKSGMHREGGQVALPTNACQHEQTGRDRETGYLTLA